MWRAEGVMLLLLLSDVACDIRIAQETVRAMNCARSYCDRLMEMDWRALLRLVEGSLLHALSLCLTMPPVLFLFDVYLLCFSCSFALALLCDARLAGDLAKAWKREARALRRLRGSFVWSLRLRWRLSRGLLAQACETCQRVAS